MDTDRNATSRTDWPALCKGPVLPCAMNILQQIKEHNPKSSTSLACSRSSKCMKPFPPTPATRPFQHVKNKTSWILSKISAAESECLGGAVRVGAKLEEIHDIKMGSWSMRVLSMCCDHFGPNMVITWDLEAVYARDEWA